QDIGQLTDFEPRPTSLRARRRRYLIRPGRLCWPWHPPTAGGTPAHPGSRQAIVIEVAQGLGDRKPRSAVSCRELDGPLVQAGAASGRSPVGLVAVQERLGLRAGELGAVAGVDYQAG